MKILQAFVVLSFLGMVGLGTTVFIGFEEANTAMLVVSSLLFLAAPIAILVHLTMTKELSPEARRIWVRELLSARSPQALSAYLNSEDRAATAELLASRTSR